MKKWYICTISWYEETVHIISWYDEMVHTSLYQEMVHTISSYQKIVCTYCFFVISMLNKNILGVKKVQGQEEAALHVNKSATKSSDIR